MVQIQNVVDLGFDLPLWVKLSVVTSIISYGYLRYKWTALNGLGFEIIPPKLLKFGTSGHYGRENGYPEFGKEELIDKNRKTVSYYRFTDPVVWSIDPELIKVKS